MLRRYPGSVLATRNRVSEKDSYASQWEYISKLIIEAVLYIIYSVSVENAASN